MICSNRCIKEYLPVMTGENRSILNGSFGLIFLNQTLKAVQTFRLSEMIKTQKHTLLARIPNFTIQPCE